MGLLSPPYILDLFRFTGLLEITLFYVFTTSEDHSTTTGSRRGTQRLGERKVLVVAVLLRPRHRRSASSVKQMQRAKRARRAKNAPALRAADRTLVMGGELRASAIGDGAAAQASSIATTEVANASRSFATNAREQNGSLTEYNGEVFTLNYARPGGALTLFVSEVSVHTRHSAREHRSRAPLHHCSPIGREGSRLPRATACFQPHFCVSSPTLRV